MDLEVSETIAGTLVPTHLLLFDADLAMQSYYRYVLETNYQKGILKRNTCHCQTCYSDLIINDHPRIQPGQRQTQKIKKLLSKMKSKYLTKKELGLTKKYLNSSVAMTIKCCLCGNMNKIPLITTANKLNLKAKLVSSKMIETKIALPVVKKKRKKKKKVKPVDQTCGLLISDSQQNLSDPTNLSQAIRSVKAENPSELARLSTPSTLLSKFHNKMKPSNPNTGNLKTHKAKPEASKNALKKHKHRQLKDYLSQAKTETHNVSLSDFLSSL